MNSLNRPGHGARFGNTQAGFRRVPSKQGPPKLDLFSIFCLPPSHGLKTVHGAKISSAKRKAYRCARSRFGKGVGFSRAANAARCPRAFSPCGSPAACGKQVEILWDARVD